MYVEISFKLLLATMPSLNLANAIEAASPLPIISLPASGAVVN